MSAYFSAVSWSLIKNNLDYQSLEIEGAPNQRVRYIPASDTRFAIDLVEEMTMDVANDAYQAGEPLRTIRKVPNSTSTDEKLADLRRLAWGTSVRKVTTHYDKLYSSQGCLNSGQERILRDFIERSDLSIQNQREVYCRISQAIWKKIESFALRDWDCFDKNEMCDSKGGLMLQELRLALDSEQQESLELSQEDLEFLGGANAAYDVADLDCTGYAFLKARVPEAKTWIKHCLKREDYSRRDAFYRGGATILMREWGFRQVQDLNDGDFVLYFNTDTNTVRHTGVFRESGLVESKMGLGATVVSFHDLRNVPGNYGRHVLFFRRSGASFSGEDTEVKQAKSSSASRANCKRGKKHGRRR